MDKNKQKLELANTKEKTNFFNKLLMMLTHFLI